jgi:circadian clock protein KaiC
MIETGWLRGTSTIVAGPSGAGKTVLGLHFLREGVANGEPGLLVTFQETPTQLARVMQSFGWEPSQILAPGRLQVFYTSPVELQIDTILTELFRRIEANGVRRVVVDALSDLARSAQDRLRYRDYLYALAQQLAQRNITSMLLQEKTDANQNPHSPGPEVSNLSDNIMLLEMDLEDELRRYIRIVKARGSAHDGRRHVLRITPRGLAVE